MNYEVNLVNYEIIIIMALEILNYERNQSAHAILFAAERYSKSITENIRSTLYSPRELKKP